MNIGLFGYGKMGKMIEKLASERGHTIIAKVDIKTMDIDFSNMDVAIDFSIPEAAFKNINQCFENDVPVVSGTTGWLKDYDKAAALCHQKNGAFIYASNFSLGVNLFFELNKQLAKMMKEFNAYQVSIEDIHHIHKLDAPSGTAITLAEGVIDHSGYTGWKLEKAPENEIPITSKRIAETPGTHSIDYDSEVDSIQIKHTAHNRNGFALGAIIAAEWLVGKKGIFTMKDVLGLQ